MPAVLRQIRLAEGRESSVVCNTACTGLVLEFLADGWLAFLKDACDTGLLMSK